MGEIVKLSNSNLDSSREDFSKQSKMAEVAKDHQDQPVYYLVSNDMPPNALLGVENQAAQVPVGDEFDNVGDTLWTMANYALRDLLAYLVQKWRIDEVMDSKVKAQNWDSLVKEFNVFTEGKVPVSRPQIVRKWHNWKQYNKTKNKPHPFLVTGTLDEDTIRDKCKQLLERLESETIDGPLFLDASVGDQQHQQSAGLADEHESSNPQLEQIAFKPPLARLSRLQRKDFLVRRTGASASALSLKRLEHEIDMEGLNYEQEKWRIKCENQKITQQKLKYKLDIADVLLEKAELELKLKQQEAQSRGLPI